MIRAMYDHAEGTLAYDCPETRREVFTAILTDEGTLKRLGTLKLSVWCPYCATPHMIRPKLHLPIKLAGRSTFSHGSPRRLRRHPGRPIIGRKGGRRTRMRALAAEAASALFTRCLFWGGPQAAARNPIRAADATAPEASRRHSHRRAPCRSCAENPALPS